ncbi:MAG TPA: carbon starvation protein A [Anaerohalosphaeraceae bacterium]|nr:carbon starvation protein A [Anaerohalosphaeraceae bacterium]HOL88194.1 carbon starvation protein A [Anaerohalosphaeraceae bacterium]HPP56053.1 carbon starvation protein A [Anaerohalosphaeraceae bacterium]
MDALLLMLLCGAGYVIAYHTYGRFLARKIFRLNPDAPVPSREFQDGVDYVPSRKEVIFGHHFTSIAGTGPIVGPAIGIIWGWLPALLWVTLGCILMGAVHDFGTLVISLRNEGKSISEIAARYINPRVRLIFFLIVFLALLIIIAIFGVVIATVFKLYPECILAIWLQIPIAVLLGWAIYKRNAPLTFSTFLAVTAMYVTVALGAWLEGFWKSRFGHGVFAFLDAWPIPSTGTWTIILLIYCWFASTLPVTTLLQPRDYINAWQLFLIMMLLGLSVPAAALRYDNFHLSAPAYLPRFADVPPLLPMMFVTIACGAISGFHSLVASGTSPKQISRETDAQFIGYGSMLVEGMLAVLVIICIAAGLGIGTGGLAGRAAWDQFYTGWMEGRGLGNNLQPVVIGASNMLAALGIPAVLGAAIMGVFVSSFAGTTMDTAVRIQRYVIGELAADFKLPRLANRWTATTLAVLTAAAVAFINTSGGRISFGADAKGALRLWPLFGTVNQLMAALALLVVTMYLKRKGGWKFLIAAVPCLIMLTLTGWAMILNEISYFRQQNWLLCGLGGAVFLLACWMTIETLVLFLKGSTAPLQEQEKE